MIFFSHEISLVIDPLVDYFNTLLLSLACVAFRVIKTKQKTTLLFVCSIHAFTKLLAFTVLLLLSSNGTPFCMQISYSSLLLVFLFCFVFFLT